MRTFATCLVLLTGVSIRAAEPPKSPLSPEESLKHFVLADPNLQIEIVAAEPEVIDPVAIQFDEHGHLWVVELSDYPNGPEPGKPPLSRIKLLEDKDGDGRYETAHIFADKLLFATGVQPWDGGVIVTLAGEVAYFKDTDGDHKADVRETWFTGFAQSNPQLRANHPTFGPDGWIYVANGLRGGNVIAVKKDWPEKVDGRRSKVDGNGRENADPQPSTINPQPISLTGRDFKFDPLTGRYEAISGNGQFGMTFDAWGNRFVCDNRHPCRHVIFEEDFIKRCPHVAFPAVVHDVIPADDKNQVFPLTSAWTTSNLHAGTFTAACGVTVYTGDWLPEEFRGNVFVCEPTGNLVQRAILEPDGVTFKSRNPYARSPVAPRQEKPNAPTTSVDKSTPNGQSESTARSADLSRSDRATGTQEFLASRDDWFRPVDLQNGPDGALYVVDMYRAVIEHPEWVPDELKKRPDTWLGNDMGRIYRIREIDGRQFQPRQGRLPRRPFLPKQLKNPFTKLNEHQRGWLQTTASRLLHERLIRSDGMSVLKSELRAARHRDVDDRDDVYSGYAPTSAAVWNSEMLSENERPFDVLGNFPDREKSGDFGRSMLSRLTAKALDDTVDRPTRDRYAMAAFQLLFSGLQERYAGDRPFHLQAVQTWHALAPSPGANVALIGNMACAHRAIDDPWLRQAMVAAMSDEPAAFLTELIQLKVHRVFWSGKSGDHDGVDVWRGTADFYAAVSEQVGLRGTRPELVRAVAMLSEAALEDETIGGHFPVAGSGLLGLAKGLSRRRDDLNLPLHMIGEGSVEAFATLTAIAIQVSRGAKRNPHFQELPRRQIAIRLLPLLNELVAVENLQEVATHEPDQVLRVTAIESLATIRRRELDSWFIERFPLETPAIRRAILAALFASKERQLRLLGAIEQGQIAATELDPVRVNQLTQAKDETLRERAKTVLAAAAPASRHEVLDAYRPALALTSDPKRGREVFVKNCSTCHRVDNVGVNVAPDISDTRTKKPEQLLLDILDPNKAIDANYFAYAVVTKEGKVESGVISAETATSITLKQPEGKVLTLLRTDIDELRNTGLSLMPVGVEKNIDLQAMADLVFWLKNWRYLDGKVPATSLGGK